jgi:hypothetical protein
MISRSEDVSLWGKRAGSRSEREAGLADNRKRFQTEMGLAVKSI